MYCHHKKELAVDALLLSEYGSYFFSCKYMSWQETWEAFKACKQTLECIKQPCEAAEPRARFLVARSRSTPSWLNPTWTVSYRSHCGCEQSMAELQDTGPGLAVKKECSVLGGIVFEGTVKEVPECCRTKNCKGYMERHKTLTNCLERHCGWLWEKCWGW